MAPFSSPSPPYSPPSDTTSATHASFCSPFPSLLGQKWMDSAAVCRQWKDGHQIKGLPRFAALILMDKDTIMTWRPHLGKSSSSDSPVSHIHRGKSLDKPTTTHCLQLMTQLLNKTHMFSCLYRVQLVWSISFIDRKLHLLTIKMYIRIFCKP